jgi:hypothetical protein
MKQLLPVGDKHVRNIEAHLEWQKTIPFGLIYSYNMN